MTPSQLLTQNRSQILAVSQQFAVANIRVFGSAAKGLDTADSDLDILVDTLPHTTLFDLGGLKIELEELLGIKVDVLTPNSIPPQFRKSVEQQAHPI